jgi:uncharacterized protein YpmS
MVEKDTKTNTKLFKIITSVVLAILLLIVICIFVYILFLRKPKPQTAEDWLRRMGESESQLIN